MTKQEQWQQHIDNWKASNLSREQFCKQNDLKFYTFQYWLRKLTPSQGNNETESFIPVSIKPT